MSDIVERLRDMHPNFGDRPMCKEAAAEIERLRAALSDEMLAEIKRTIPVKPEVANAIFYILRHDRRTGAEMTYEEKLEAMAEAMWQAENVRMMGKPRLVEWTEAGDQQHMHWRASAYAAAEAIGLREMMEALESIAKVPT